MAGGAIGAVVDATAGNVMTPAKVRTSAPREQAVGFRPAVPCSLIGQDPNGEVDSVDLSHRPTYSECERHGIDAAEIRRRLSLFSLGPEMDGAIERAQGAIRPHLDGIVDAFYAYLGGVPELAFLLADGERTTRLRLTQRSYLETLGSARETLGYFESRLRIGRAHERVGLAPSYYLGAYARLLLLIGEQLASRPSPSDVSETCLVVQRIFWLDADLAMMAYHGTRHDAVVDSVRHDPLTGVASRGFLMARLAEECGRAERFSRPFAVVFVDLDGFKIVNDEAGHDAGDRILAAVGDCIRRGVRPSDVVGRYGGDEFVIGVVEGNVDTACDVAERVSAQIATRLAGEPRRPTASFGVATRRSGEAADTLVHRADIAMYAAKRAGKNRTVVDAVDAS